MARCYRAFCKEGQYDGEEATARKVRHEEPGGSGFTYSTLARFFGYRFEAKPTSDVGSTLADNCIRRAVSNSSGSLRHDGRPGEFAPKRSGHSRRQPYQ